MARANVGLAEVDDSQVEAVSGEEPVHPTSTRSFEALYAKLAAPFDKTFQRDMPGGRGTLTYITGEQAIQRLTDVLGPYWEWTVDRQEQLGDHVVVTGTLAITIYPDSLARTVSRSGIGGAAVKKRRDGGIMDLGNDFKAAETGALKRAAAKFGVGLYLYGKSEGGEDELPAQPVTYGTSGNYAPAQNRPAVQFASPQQGTPVQTDSGTTGVIRAINGKGSGLTLQGIDNWFNVSSRTPVDLSQFQRGQLVTITHRPGSNFIDAISGPNTSASQQEELEAF